jgi:hypothetical protein
MEHVGSEYLIILNDSQLRQGLIRDTERAHRSGQTTSGNQVVRRWLAQALHRLALASIRPVAHWTSSWHQRAWSSTPAMAELTRSETSYPFRTP